MNFLEQFWALWLESSPWLLLGLLVAGFLKAFIPQAWMQQQLGGKGRWSVIKAAFIGAPLPLCSCGVVPAALGLRQAGASKGSTVSFLVATPETGPDSVSLSYALLGPFMAIIRPIAAISSAIVAGLLVRSEEVIEASPQNQDDEAVKSESLTKSSSCCDSAKKVIEPTTSCCSSKNTEKDSVVEDESIRHKLSEGLSFSFGKLLTDIAGWLLLGISFAAIVQAFVPQSWLAEWGSGVLAMVVMAVIGVPMYICASASTPIAAGLLLAGVSPGAVLVFMLAGPATNIGTLGIIKKELGKQSLFAYLIGVIATALMFGVMTDFIVQNFTVTIPIRTVEMAHHAVSWWEHASALILIAVILNAYWREKSR
ncbi:MAG: SO_0444 family Cu/Zn efflux transporter [Gammaproteobacteria bacterium]|nr:SO_0444 family Cu/Zn efflux transporter [Gammaproteobacteria bacterium]